MLLDENGEPRVFAHAATNERRGEEMSEAELLSFAVDVLVTVYEQQGMKVCDISKSATVKSPNFVLESRNGKLYFVLVNCSSFPSTTGRLSGLDLSPYANEAHNNGALPTIAEVGVYCFDTDGAPPICGGSFAVKFDSLEALRDPKNYLH